MVEVVLVVLMVMEEDVGEGKVVETDMRGCSLRGVEDSLMRTLLRDRERPPATLLGDEVMLMGRREQRGK